MNSKKIKKKRNKAYCLHCKKINQIINPTVERTKNNRYQLSGECKKCNMKIKNFISMKI